MVTSCTRGQMASNTAAARFNVFYPIFLQNVSFIYMPSSEKKVWVQILIFFLVTFKRVANLACCAGFEDLM